MNFKAPDWVHDAIFYEIFPDRFYNSDKSNDPPGIEPWGNRPSRRNFFGGDLKGIIQKLPYLEELGVNALYLTPIFDAPSNHKYDTRDYFKIDKHFGDLDTLRELVEAAHSRGIRIVLDGVFNHTGDQFWAFRDIIEHGESSKYVNWYFIESFPMKKHPINYRTCGDVSYLPKLNAANPEVREYLLNVAKYWLDKTGIDGWRLDTPWLISSSDFWKEFRKVVKSRNPDAYLVGEVWRDARPWLQGDQFDGVMNYRLRDLIIQFFVKQKLDTETFDYELKALRSSCSIEASYAMLNLLGSHDTPRYLTICREDVDKAIISLLFMMTYVGVPMIYYGDEIGMRGGNDPLCRGTMIWDKDQWNQKLFKVYQKMIQLRKQHPSLRRGSYETLYKMNRIYVYKREYLDDLLLIIINSGLRERSLKVPVNSIKQVASGGFRDIMSGQSYEITGHDLAIPHLEAKSGLVLESVP